MLKTGAQKWEPSVRLPFGENLEAWLGLSVIFRVHSPLLMLDATEDPIRDMATALDCDVADFGSTLKAFDLAFISKASCLTAQACVYIGIADRCRRHAACLLRGYGCDSTQNDHLGRALPNRMQHAQRMSLRVPMHTSIHMWAAQHSRPSTSP